MITLKRAYDAVSRTDGTRFLVERLWPRGISKAKLRVDAWLKEVGPSTELRKWFSHDPEKWDEFRRRYFRELASQPEAWQPIVSAARRGRVTLVYSSHDTQHNNAVALQEFLRKKARRPARSTRTSAAHRPRRLAAVIPVMDHRQAAHYVRAAAYSAVSPRSHGVGASAPSTQSDRPLGWHDVPTCDRRWEDGRPNWRCGRQARLPRRGCA